MSPKNLNVSKKTHKNFLSNLRDKRLFKIYKKFEKILSLDQDFIVGISGGPDSLALCILTNIYSIKKSLNAHYFLVDHRLRKNSSTEAQSIKKLLKKHNIKLDILNWYGKKPNSNIQSLARNKRYSLLINQAKKLNIKTILTGHHKEDIFENFFIRISRGSGLNGLVSFSQKSQRNNIDILRPLISFKKKNLNYVTLKVFKSYIQDPSNNENKYKRVRIRKLIRNLKKEGLDEKKFELTIKNLTDSNETIKFYVAKNLKDNSFIYRDKSKIILNEEFFNQPHEITFRSLTEVIKFVGNKYYSVRGKKVDRIIDKLKSYTKISLKLTLGNCIINKVNRSIIVVKEH